MSVLGGRGRSRAVLTVRHCSQCGRRSRADGPLRHAVACGAPWCTPTRSLHCPSPSAARGVWVLFPPPAGSPFPLPLPPRPPPPRPCHRLLSRPVLAPPRPYLPSPLRLSPSPVAFCPSHPPPPPVLPTFPNMVSPPQLAGLRICCIGAGYVGGPTMAMMAHKCPEVTVTVRVGVKGGREGV